MAEGLFVTSKDLKRLSALSGNIDDDKIKQYVKIAQDIHIQNYLGTDLFNKIQGDIESSSLTGVYLTLVNDYVKDMVIHWSLVEIVSALPYTLSNKGVFKHFSENSETVSKSEVDSIITIHRERAQSYTRRFIDYMCYNSSTFPEYTSNTNEDISPSKDADFGGWVL